jgi:hypothetical protein
MPKANAPIDLRNLIRTVEERGSGSQPLDRVALAVKYGEALKALGDELIGYFVEDARAAGCSWSQIGAHLGVTKQAAQQRHRFVGLFGRRRGRAEGRSFERFTEEARQVVVRAQDEARRLNHNYLGTEHLLLALLRDRQATAAQVLRDLGLALHDVRNEVKRIIGLGSEAPGGPIPLTPRAKKALELSRRAAGDSPIWTEHLLLGLLDEGEGVAAHILKDRGVTHERIKVALAK